MPIRCPTTNPYTRPATGQRGSSLADRGRSRRASRPERRRRGTRRKRQERDQSPPTTRLPKWTRHLDQPEPAERQSTLGPEAGDPAGLFFAQCGDASQHPERERRPGPEEEGLDVRGKHRGADDGAGGNGADRHVNRLPGRQPDERPEPGPADSRERANRDAGRVVRATALAGPSS